MLTENKCKFHIESLFAADPKQSVAFCQQWGFPAFLHFKNLTHRNTKIIVITRSGTQTKYNKLDNK